MKMNRTPDIDPGYVSGVIEEILGSRIDHTAIAPLPGDASDRRYYRVSFKTEKRESLIIMKLSEPDESEQPPFINIQNYLKNKKIPVPDILYYDRTAGLILLEDLGPITLEERLKQESLPAVKKLYKEAIDILLRMQGKSEKKERERCLAYTLEFDEEKLMWELDFFLTHMIEGLLKKRMGSADREQLRSGFLSVITLLTGEKKVFTHRDYHSRNIIMNGDTFGIVDFQDARMGLCQYDLASLLRDSYFVLDEETEEELVDYYIDKKEGIEKKKIDRKQFLKVFDYMSIQRNLKAVGTFSYQKVAKKNDRYLQHIGDTLEYVKNNFEKHKELAALGKVLWKYLE